MLGGTLQLEDGGRHDSLGTAFSLPIPAIDSLSLEITMHFDSIDDLNYTRRVPLLRFCRMDILVRLRLDGLKPLLRKAQF